MIKYYATGLREVEWEFTRSFYSALAELFSIERLNFETEIYCRIIYQDLNNYFNLKFQDLM